MESTLGHQNHVKFHRAGSKIHRTATLGRLTLELRKQAHKAGVEGLRVNKYSYNAVLQIVALQLSISKLLNKHIALYNLIYK